MKLLSIVLPCLNEAETLGACLTVIRETLEQNRLNGEVIVADNGSTDHSARIARDHGARIISVPERGYGNALIAGINAADGEFIIMGDADMSYDFREIPNFLAKLTEGYDLVMGNRFKGGIEPGAMPPANRYIGNPVLTGIGTLLFRWPIRDAHCGLRGFRKDAYRKMQLTTVGMEFASEMVLKATLLKMRMTEIPIKLRPDGRSRRPHLSPLRDGWRHLSFLLLFSPRWLFLYPGILLSSVGLTMFFWLLPEPRTMWNVTFDIHTLLISALTIILGFQIMTFALFARSFAELFGYHPVSPILERITSYFSLERGLVAGCILSALGLFLLLSATIGWGSQGFGEQDPSITMRMVIPGALLVLLGVQTIFTSFFLRLPTISRTHK